MGVCIEWRDGTVDRGPTPESVIQLLGESQFTPLSPSEMVRALSDRTWICGGNAVDPELPLEEFFAKLAEVDVCTIREWSPEAVAGGGIGQATSRRPSMRERRERY